MSQPQETKILNGVTTFDGQTDHVIRIKEKKEEGIFGTTSNEIQALHIIECIGKDELAKILKKTDRTWTKVESKLDAKNMTYTITVQQLGRLRNGPIETYLTVTAEQVPKVYQAEYVRNELVDGPIEKPKEESETSK